MNLKPSSRVKLHQRQSPALLQRQVWAILGIDVKVNLTCERTYGVFRLSETDTEIDSQTD